MKTTGPVPETRCFLITGSVGKVCMLLSRFDLSSRLRRGASPTWVVWGWHCGDLHFRGASQHPSGLRGH